MRAGSTKRSSGTINKDGLNSHTRHFLVESNKKSKTPRQDTPKWSFISSELSVCVCAHTRVSVLWMRRSHQFSLYAFYEKKKLVVLKNLVNPKAQFWLFHNFFNKL